MLSGQRAFRGETAADTITAILTKEPPDLSTTNKDIHPGIDRIVRHCLEKNPEERFESARDLAFDLEALSGVSGSTTTGAMRAVSTESRPRTRWTGAVLASILLALAAGVGGGLLAGRRLTERPPVSFRQLTFRRGPIQSARFAPGRRDDHLHRGLGWPTDGALHDAPRQPGVAAVRPDGAEVLLDLLDGRDGGFARPATSHTGFTRIGTLSRHRHDRRRRAEGHPG